MKKYDGIVFREIIKRKKRTIFTLLSITFSLAILILVGEVDNLNHVGKLDNIKFQWGDIHGKIVNISGEQALKLKQNSLIKDIGYSMNERYERFEKDEKGNIIEQIVEDVFYADKEYFNNILFKDYIEMQGEYPKNENEVILVNPSDKNIKIGDKAIVKEKKRTVVGILNTKNENPHMDYYKILGIEDVSKLPKVTANIRLAKEKDMARSIVSVGKSVGVDYIFNAEKQYWELENTPFIDINFNIINNLGEKIEVEGFESYPNKSSEILQGILIVTLIFLTYITINVSVKDKRKTYSILKCIGASNGQIRTLILKEGIVIAILSIMPGVILGEIIFYTISGNLLNIINEFKLLIEYKMNLKMIAVGIILVILVVSIASLIPMIWISKLSPVDGIKECGLKSSKRRIRSKFVRKLLGCEGEIAYKNLRRDKASLIGLTLTMVMSLIIFNVFTNYYKFKLDEMEKNFGVMGKDLKVFSLENTDKIEKVFKKYEEYGEVSQRDEYKVLLRLKGLDEEIIKDSKAYQYHDEKKEFIMSKEIGSPIFSLDDKGFNDILPYIEGKDLTLEEFKNEGVILFTSGDDGALHFPKNNEEIEIYINDGEAIDKFENTFNNPPTLGKFIVPKEAKTTVEKVKVIGTAYLETVTGEGHSGGKKIGILISKDFAKKLKLKNLQDRNFIYEFKDESTREEYEEQIIEEINKIDDHYAENTAKIKAENLNYLKAFAKIIYTILGFIIALMILSIVNIRDIVLNNRKKEFGTLFSIGMDKKMLKKSLIYEGLIQGILALIIGNIVSIKILIFMQSDIKKFTFSYGILLIGSLGIMVICILNILNSVRRLSPKNTIDLMRNIE